MERRRFFTIRVRLWGLLFVAFASVGLSVAVAIAYFNGTGDRDERRARLQEVAAVMAAGVDLDSVAPRGAPGLQVNDAARARLAAAARALPELTAVYLCEATSQGLSSDAVYLGPRPPTRDLAKRLAEHRFETPSADLMRAFSTATSTVEEATPDRPAVGALTVNMPITSRAGEPVTVLVVEAGFDGQDPRFAVIAAALPWGVGLAAAIAALCATIISRTIIGRRVQSVIQDRSRWRFGLLEVTLAALLCSVLAVGVGTTLSNRTDQRELAQILVDISNLSAFEHGLQSHLMAHEEPAATQAWIASAGTTLHQNWAVVQAGTSSPRPGALQDILRSARQRLTQFSDQTATMQAAILAQSERQQLGLVVSLLVTLAAIAIVRLACLQQSDLFDVTADATRILTAYRQVAENLPIGFFTYRDGQVRYANHAWDVQFGRDGNEPRDAAVRRALALNDFQRLDGVLRNAEAAESSFVATYPVVTGNHTLHIESRGVPIFDDEGRLEHLLGFAVDVTSRVSQHAEIEAKQAELVLALQDLEANFEAMVYSLVKAVEAKDPYTAGHSERVMRYSVMIGERMGLSMSDLRILRLGTLIHDVGKIGLPDAILGKPGHLTEEEMTLVREHPTIGARMVGGIPKFRPCLPIVLMHHERLDGSGYPHGVKGDDIPIMVRIAAVADTFDAMTSNRSYRMGRPADVAIAEMAKVENGMQLDLEIVAVLADIIQDGHWIEGSNLGLAA